MTRGCDIHDTGHAMNVTGGVMNVTPFLNFKKLIDIHNKDSLLFPSGLQGTLYYPG